MICARCGKSFEKLICTIRSANVFCSGDCSKRHIFETRSKNKVCKYCGKRLEMGEGWGGSKKNKSYTCNVCYEKRKKGGGIFSQRKKLLKIQKRLENYKRFLDLGAKCSVCGKQVEYNKTSKYKKAIVCSMNCRYKHSYKTKPKYVINQRMRVAIRKALRGGKHGRRWEGLVGYTLEQLCAHLEKQFLPGMGWHNMGEWHIDHIVPKSGYNYQSTDDPDFKRAWALENLQPLWAEDNLKKSAGGAWILQPSLPIG